MSDQKFVPIYQQLFEKYQQAIQTQVFSPGARIDSINELIQKHRVSRETAKLVLQKLADAGLIVKRAGKGSFVADLGPRQKSWGIVVPYYSTQIDELLNLLSFEAVKLERNFEQFIDYNNWEEEIRLVGSLINQRYEAVIVIPTMDETKTANFYMNLVSGGTVVTLLDHTMSGSYFTYAIQSYDLGVQRAVQHLHNTTPGNLAFIKNTTWAGRNMVQELMEATFINYVELQPDMRKAVVFNQIFNIAPQSLRDENITGIFCCDDFDAVRIVGRLLEWEFQIPYDISVLSYGNTDLARYFTPRISSIDTHNEEMIQRTTEIIQAHLNGKDVRYAQYVIQPELLIRET